MQQNTSDSSRSEEQGEQQDENTQLEELQVSRQDTDITISHCAIAVDDSSQSTTSHKNISSHPTQGGSREPPARIVAPPDATFLQRRNVIRGTGAALTHSITKLTELMEMREVATKKKEGKTKNELFAELLVLEIDDFPPQHQMAVKQKLYEYLEQLKKEFS